MDRRNFLIASAGVSAGMMVGSRRLFAVSPSHTVPVGSLLPDVISADQLRKFAVVAMDVARHMGVIYADVRIADRRLLNLRMGPSIRPTSYLGFECTYGVRVLVGGAWGFVYGSDPESEDIVRDVRRCVESTRAQARLAGPLIELASSPVIKDGEWAAPVHIDPFEVSPDDHCNVLGAYKTAANRVLNLGVSPEFTWSDETRVFCSTEGSIITQRMRGFVPNIELRSSRRIGQQAELPLIQLTPASVGFEAVLGATLQEQIKQRAEDVATLLRYPERDSEVGRFEVVADGVTVGAMASATLAPALELDRVLGHRVNEAGSSFLAPPNDVLMEPARFSTNLSLEANVSPSAFGTVKWDDEGVLVRRLPLIQQGKVVDYFTTRATAPALRVAYQQQGRPVVSNGSARTGSPVRSPEGMGTSLSLASNVESVTLDDLVKDVGNGIVIRGGTRVSSDHQLMSGALYPPMVFEVKSGKIVARLRRAGVQFQTSKLWRSVGAIGGSTTVQHVLRNTSRNQPAAVESQVVSAPAIHFREVDLIQLSRGG